MRDDDYRPREVRATCGECGCSTTRHAQGCPETPDDPEDDRALDQLTPAEQRARLATLTRDELVMQCLESLEDAAMWWRQHAQEHELRLRELGRALEAETKAARYLTELSTAELRLHDAQEQLADARREIAGSRVAA